VAIVTGGTRGIGEAISIALNDSGMKVAATYAGNDQRAAEFTERTGIPAYKWDVADHEACQQGVRKIEADLGPHAAHRIAAAFGAQRFGRSSTEDEVKEALAEAVAAELIPRQGRFEPLAGPRPFVVLFIGVNGSGKTTSIGKLARALHEQGLSVLLVAGDTFRAAAVEQLHVWAERSGASFSAQQTGADPGAVIFDAVQSAQARHIDVVLADTAGRLHNQTHLMDELKKVKRVIQRLDAAAPQEVLLVLDANQGQNALSQAQQFHAALGVTGLILTKLDGSARGGIVVAIARALKLPIRFIGVGEKPEDFGPFNARAFATALIDGAVT